MVHAMPRKEIIQAPLMSANPNLSADCKCMDLDHNTIINLDDFGRFQRCYSGDNTHPVVDPTCDD